ncbi:hypothetical protein GOP47_0018486 [Adiantum capillus-veneris]|uniref:Dynein axonemal assembly factor 11-like CS domain-containing protein n=1 Tax=Adiantum capillus-veneris TaxID=13818 RepID=A0A9D4UDV7_ADICA|nr:hypothetical protein GOP47_0018486 [Adiantum capillus-veneris]
MYNSIFKKLSTKIDTTLDDTVEETASTINGKGQAVREYTPATRLAEHAELEEMRGGRKVDKEVSSRDSKKSQRHAGFDPLPIDGRIYQKNEGGWNFQLTESECKSKVLLDVPVGRYMDISLIDVDVQPTWVRVLAKGKLLQLQLPDEVNPDKSVAQRSNTTGNLLICMPKASCNMKINVKDHKTRSLFYCEEPKKPIKANMKAGRETSIAANTDKSMNFDEKISFQEPLDVSTVSFKDFKSKEFQEIEMLDGGDFGDLPALE